MEHYRHTYVAACRPNILRTPICNRTNLSSSQPVTADNNLEEKKKGKKKEGEIGPFVKTSVAGDAIEQTSICRKKTENKTSCAYTTTEHDDNSTKKQFACCASTKPQQNTTSPVTQQINPRTLYYCCGALQYDDRSWYMRETHATTTKPSALMLASGLQHTPK